VLKLPGNLGAVALPNATVLGFASTLLLTGASAALAQTAAPSTGSREIDAVRATTPPVIDGDVGESEWLGAASAAGFFQYEPQRGDRSDSQTEALVLYDSEHLYVAFRAWDPEPITAQLTQRDAELLRDDAVVVVVDTTNDRRSGYYFITNVLGTRPTGESRTMGAPRNRFGTPRGSLRQRGRTMGGRRNSVSRCRRSGTSRASARPGASTSAAAVAERSK